MADSFSKIYIHVVMTVQRRNCLISRTWKDRLYQYMTGIIRNKGQKLIIIGGMPDHIHILMEVKPTCALSDLMRELKAMSSKWINENKLVLGRFEWQKGFGAFSVGYSQVDHVCRYIINQESHHKRRSFREEYINLLEENDISYQAEYIFHCLEDK